MDLHLLTSALCPEKAVRLSTLISLCIRSRSLLAYGITVSCYAVQTEQVAELDEHWTFDSLLNEVSQEMQKDADEREEFQRAEGA